MDGDHLSFVAPTEKRTILNLFDQIVRMVGILGDYEHERLYDWLVIVSGKYLQLHLGVLVDSDAVLQLQFFETSLVVVLDVKVLSCGYRWFFYETVLHGTRQRIAIDHVLEWLRPSNSLYVRGGSEFQPQ